MEESLKKKLSKDPNGLMTYEYIANNIDNVDDIMPELVDNIIMVDHNGQFVVSKRITLGAYFDHQVNTPLVSSSAYPTTNSNYGLSVNMSLAK